MNPSDDEPSDKELFGSSASGVPNVPESVMDEILRTGGNQRNGIYRIIAHHQLYGEGFPEMLREEFTQRGKHLGGCGIVADGQRFASWYTPEGIHVAQGNTYQSENAVLLTWERAAERIGSMLDKGAYAPQAMVNRAIWSEYVELADALCRINQANDRSNLLANPPTFLPAELFAGGSREASSRIANQLDEPRFLKTVDTALKNLQAEYLSNDTLQSALSASDAPQEVRNRLQKLWNEPKKYPASVIIPNAKAEFFITDDEIREAIKDTLKPNPLINHTAEFHRFFAQSHTQAEKTAFFQSLFGTVTYADGVSHAYGTSVFCKPSGITFSLGFSEEYADVTLTWQEYADKVDELIQLGEIVVPPAMETAKDTDTSAVEVTPVEPLPKVAELQPEPVVPPAVEPTAIEPTDPNTEVLDEFLRTGGNRRNGVYRIIAHHQFQGQDFVGMVRDEFSQNRIVEGGRGIALNGVKFSAWYGKDGVQMAKGSTVHSKNASFYTWEQVAGRIVTMLEQGIYQPQVIVNEAADRERLECAGQLWELHRDRDDEHPNYQELALIDSKSSNFPEETATVAEHLKDSVFLAELLQKLEKFCEKYRQDSSILRFDYMNPEKVCTRLSKLTNEPRHYPETAFALRDKSYFITNDEIDDVIGKKHSSWATTRLGLYSFFIHIHTTKEKTAFLKNKYGLSGSSHSVSGADNSFLDYNGTGVTLRRGDVTVKLKWEAYTKRLQELVLSGHFLSQADMDSIPKYEESYLVSKIRNFFYRNESFAPYTILPNGMIEPNNQEKEIRQFLKEPNSLSQLEDAMLKVISMMEASNEAYDSMMQTYGEVVSYRKGTFSLFTPSTELEAQANKNGVSLVVHPFRTAKREELVYRYQEGNTVFVEGKTYEIAEIHGDTVIIRDSSFPLIPEVYQRQELDTLLALDSKNEYLLGEPESKIEQKESLQQAQPQDVVEKPVTTVERAQNVASEPVAESKQPKPQQGKESKPLLPKESVERLNYRITDDGFGCW